jgi:hypothetical protein
MRKLFIGCGVVILVIVALGAWFSAPLWPTFSRWHSEWNASIEELNALDDRYPFDIEAQTHLDPARFATMLDLRVELTEYFLDIHDELMDLDRRYEADEVGFVEVFKTAFERLTPIWNVFHDELDDARMGRTEFAWLTRVLWASLARVDAGVADPELQPLRDSYNRYKAIYDELVRQDRTRPPLQELLSGIPPAVLSEAETVLRSDVARVQRGLQIVDLDHVYMQPLTRIEDLQLLDVQAQPAPEEPADR